MDKRGIRDGVHLGGALMLPYFKFPKPGEDEIKEVAYAESFLEQSRGALDYYHRLFEKEQRKTFDQLYLVGWDPLIELPVFEKVEIYNVILLYFQNYLLLLQLHVSLCQIQ